MCELESIPGGVKAYRVQDGKKTFKVRPPARGTGKGKGRGKKPKGKGRGKGKSNGKGKGKGKGNGKGQGRSKGGGKPGRGGRRPGAPRVRTIAPAAEEEDPEQWDEGPWIEEEEEAEEEEYWPTDDWDITCTSDDFVQVSTLHYQDLISRDQSQMPVSASVSPQESGAAEGPDTAGGSG